MRNFFKKYWFMLGLVGTALLVITDATESTVDAGRWLKVHNGPDAVIVLIFFLSGLALDTRQILDGLADIKGTLLALLLIFICAPLVAFGFSLYPLQAGLLFGIFLVGSMPTTLSSGVVMTGSAGGNMAHALFITIIASSLSVITIPVTLALLLAGTGESRVVQIDQFPIMIKIATLVLLPLALGLILRRIQEKRLLSLLPYTTPVSQMGILTMVWMALCVSRQTIVDSLDSLFSIIVMVFLFHLILVLLGFVLTRLLSIVKGRREGVIFMGGQKTLPLSIIIQVSVFPEYGLAVVVCVMHHIIHLVMDAYLTGYLREKA